MLKLIKTLFLGGETYGYRAHAQVRSRILILGGIALALATFGLIAANPGALAFNQPKVTPTITVVTASVDIGPQTALTLKMITTTPVASDIVTTRAFIDPKDLVGKVAVVPIYAGQVLTPSLVMDSATGTTLAIHPVNQPDAPSGLPWRAVSISVPDALASAGLVGVGSYVDLLLSTSSGSSGDSAIVPAKTKPLFSNVQVIGKSGTMYVLRLDAQQAEIINHAQAMGAGTISFSLRANDDGRPMPSLAPVSSGTSPF